MVRSPGCTRKQVQNHFYSDIHAFFQTINQSVYYVSLRKEGKLSLFGIIVPIGLLILVALAVTFGLPIREGPSDKEILRDPTFTNGMKEINSKIDTLTKEVETIKKAIEE
jgi:hypothetical protein